MDDNPVMNRVADAVSLAEMVWGEQDAQIDDMAPVVASYYESILAGTPVPLALQAAQEFFQHILEERAKPKEAKKKVKRVLHPQVEN